MFDREYHIFGEALISEVEANNIYIKLLNEKANLNTTWRDEETHMLQFTVFTYALQH